MYCAVLIGPAGDHDSIRQGPGCSKEAQLAVHSGASQLEENNQHSWNSTSRFVVPRGTGQPRKEHDTEDTVT